MTELLAAMAGYGLNPGKIITDGKIHRFASDSKDKKKSGWYVAYSNFSKKSGQEFVVSVFGNYADPNSPWKYQSNAVNLTIEDRRAVDEQIAKAKLQQEKEREKQQLESAQEVEKLFANLLIDGWSPYLERKKIQGVKGVKYDSDGTVYIPLRDVNGKLWTFQKIFADGKKYLFAGGRKRGCSFVMGDVESSERIIFCEGLATGASIHLATGECVVVAIDSGNLVAVCTDYKKMFYEKAITIAGDDDKYSTENIGRKKAEEAAEAVVGRTAFPVFSDESSKPTDFNDLHCLEGIDVVEQQFKSTLQQKNLAIIDRLQITRVPYPDDEEFSKSARKGTLPNTRELLRRLGVIVRYNVISKEEEVLIPGMGFTSDNRANATRGYLVDWHERVKIPHGNLDLYLTIMADENQYNPVTTWIDSKPWDGQRRFTDFCDTITAKGEKENHEIRIMKLTMMRKWMISAVAAAFEPDGVVARGMLVLQGDQYIGKTKWFKTLVHASLDVRADGVMLKLDDKDSVLVAIKKWLVELGELDGVLSKSDAAQLKAFLPKQHDEIRQPYGRKASRYARRTVFFGSVNEMNFLKDPTGNTRFWVVECESIDHEHKFDMQQVWAEVKTFYRDGETWYLKEHEVAQLNAHNENFQQIDTIDERIRCRFDWSQKIENESQVRWLTATQVCKLIGIDNPGSEPKKAGTALRKLCKLIGFEPKKSGGYPRFPVPPDLPKT